MLRRTRFAALAAAVALAAPVAARANGRFPSSQYVVVGPAHESRTIVLRTTFGFAVSDDGGRTFHWICEEALDYAGPPFDPPVAIDANDRMHVALFSGLMRVAPDRCGYTRLPDVEGVYLNDLDVSPDGVTLATVSSTGTPAGGPPVYNRVYLSQDRGETFQPRGMGVPDVLFDTLEMAPTRPSRIYLTGTEQNPHAVAFYRSDDGGTTLERVPFAQGSGLSGAYIAAVDPTQADTVYVRGVIAQPPGDAGSAPDATVLLRSDDRGTTFRELVRTHGAMQGFAISDDGRTLWIGGPDPADGLQRSTDGGQTWQSLAALQVLCLRQHAGALYVCANYTRAGYALGRSMDQGVTIEPLLRFADLQAPYDCPAPADASYSVETAVCGARWPLQHAMFVPNGADAGMDAAVRDSAAQPTGTLRGGACAVGLAGHAQGSPAGVIALGVSAAAAVARRRRRRAR